MKIFYILSLYFASKVKITQFRIISHFRSQNLKLGHIILKKKLHNSVRPVHDNCSKTCTKSLKQIPSIWHTRHISSVRSDAKPQYHFTVFSSFLNLVWQTQVLHTAFALKKSISSALTHYFFALNLHHEEKYITIFPDLTCPKDHIRPVFNFCTTSGCYPGWTVTSL